MSKRCIPCDIQRIRKQFEEKIARKAAETQERSQIQQQEESVVVLKKVKRVKKSPVEKIDNPNPEE